MMASLLEPGTGRGFTGRFGTATHWSGRGASRDRLLSIPLAFVPMASGDTSPSLFDGSNRQIATFVGKVLAIYAIWYVLYDLWLLPDGTVDRWLSLNVAALSGSILDLAGFDVMLDGRVLALPGVPGISIANGCNGLSTLGLFVGFVVAYPGRTRRRLWFIPLGVLVVYATNVARVVAMLLTQKYWPAAFDPLHGFGLTTIFYVVVFGLWVLWANYGQADRRTWEDKDSSADSTNRAPAGSSLRS